MASAAKAIVFACCCFLAPFIPAHMPKNWKQQLKDIELEADEQAFRDAQAASSSRPPPEREREPPAKHQRKYRRSLESKWITGESSSVTVKSDAQLARVLWVAKPIWQHCVNDHLVWLTPRPRPTPP